jgi:tripartite-type tricarboxylate transporter receptor subunit TctC
MVNAAAIVAAFAAAVALATSDAGAQILSNRPITIVVPFTPGASADNLQRLVARSVTEKTGQVFVVESRSGGSGAIGAVAVKQAPPDGHTLFQANVGSHATNVTLYPALAYDPVRDFKPITLMWTFPSLLWVPVDSPARSMADLVALARSKPGGLNFASQGTGASGHLLGELFKKQTGAPMVHVPYRGAGPASVDLAAGRVDFFFSAYASLVALLHAGKVRPIAVASKGKRLPVLPDVPTAAEAGFAGFSLETWFGLVAPAATPDAAIDKLFAAFTQAVRDGEVGKAMVEQGAEAVASKSPAEFAAFMAAETQRIGEVVRSIGVKGE